MQPQPDSTKTSARTLHTWSLSSGHPLLLRWPVIPGLRACPPGSRFFPVGRTQKAPDKRSEEHTSELQSQSNLVCRLLLEKKKTTTNVDARPLLINTRLRLT